MRLSNDLPAWARSAARVAGGLGAAVGLGLLAAGGLVLGAWELGCYFCSRPNTAGGALLILAGAAAGAGAVTSFFWGVGGTRFSLRRVYLVSLLIVPLAALTAGLVFLD